MLHFFTWPGDLDTDTHWAFRGVFSTDSALTLRLRYLSSGWGEVRWNGEFLLEGPHRFDPDHPETVDARFAIPAGEHVVAIHWHYHGVDTRLLLGELPACVGIEITEENSKKPIFPNWKRRRLNAYRRTGRRLGCVLGWAEWCDTRKIPEDWHGVAFDARDWEPVVPQPFRKNLAEAPSADLAPLTYLPTHCTQIDDGRLINMSMVEHDPPMNFLLRDLKLTDPDLPANGRWWRFDLGKVMLGRPRILFSHLPPSALVQVAYSEVLLHGRVAPYLNSGGGENSCTMDTWISRGGAQAFQPLQPKGARFLEVHALAEVNEIPQPKVQFTERCYYGDDPQGRFSCNDSLLNKIWSVGVSTLRSCSEDAITDNPCRERGQWLGDAIGPGMEILACAYSDHRPLVRGLRQAAHCAREDGMIPAIYPGTRQYIPSFAIQWVSALPVYYRLSGNLDLMRELFPAACRTLDVFAKDRVHGGLRLDPKHWNFIDWGYAGSATNFRDDAADPRELDPALSLFYLRALRALSQWADWVEQGDAGADYRSQARELAEEIKTTWLGGSLSSPGYHVDVLALDAGFFTGKGAEKCLDRIESHISSCFPLDPKAPRLESVHVESSRLITPFFLHFALPLLMDWGRGEQALVIIRKAWEWMLNRGLTTWCEVFDPRWSHCHQWSGCPTWILSRYVLGLRPRMDLGPETFVLAPYPCGLEATEGAVPLCNGGSISIAWKNEGGGLLELRLSSSSAIRLLNKEGEILTEGTHWKGELPILSRNTTLQPVSPLAC